MKLATVLRYIDVKEGGPWDFRYYIPHDFKLMADKYGIGLVAVMSNDSIEETCRDCDGLIIPGSTMDIDPAYYGEPSEDFSQPVDEYALDKRLIDYFLAKGKPILGICAGLQELNIYFGGSIKKIDNGVPHCSKGLLKHPVRIKKDSFVYRVFGDTEAEVNTFHYWHIDRLADCLEVVAESHDGIIEAVECREKRVFATQWHPELSFHADNPVENKLFENFIECCKG